MKSGRRSSSADMMQNLPRHTSWCEGDPCSCSTQQTRPDFTPIPVVQRSQAGLFRFVPKLGYAGAQAKRDNKRKEELSKMEDPTLQSHPDPQPVQENSHMGGKRSARTREVYILALRTIYLYGEQRREFGSAEVCDETGITDMVERTAISQLLARMTKGGVLRCTTPKIKSYRQYVVIKQNGVHKLAESLEHSNNHKLMISTVVKHRGPNKRGKVTAPHTPSRGPESALPSDFIEVVSPRAIMRRLDQMQEAQIKITDLLEALVKAWQ